MAEVEQNELMIQEAVSSVLASPSSANVAPVKPNFGKPAYWGWWLAGSVPVFGTLNYLLAMAGVLNGWRLITVPVISAAARGQVIAAAIGLISGFIALLTFSISYHQKIYLQQLANFQAEQIADENREKQNEWELKRIALQEKHFRDQRNQEKAQAEYDSIAAEYDALSKDFVAKEELARINAAIGLAAIAIRPDPRRLFKEGLEPEEAPKKREYFPWYEKVASQLAAALHVYEEARARSQILSSIQIVSKIDNGESQPLLCYLIDQIADANRSAYSRFIEVLAEAASSRNALALRPLARALTVFSRPCYNANCLVSTMRRDEYKLALNAATDRLKFGSSESSLLPQEPGTDPLKKLNLASQQLVGTRDALANCLRFSVRKGGYGPGGGEPGMRVEGYSQSALDEDLGGLPELKLSGTFLQGADLSYCQMAKADLRFSQLHRANMRGSKFQGANLDSAQLRRADLGTAKLQGAWLNDSDLSGASLRETQLQDAILNHCNLRGAHLYGTNLTSAWVIRADLSRATVQSANLEKAHMASTNVQGASIAWLIGLGTAGSPNCSDMNWWDADFFGWRLETKALMWIRDETEDSQTRDWFESNYPRSVAPDG